jgi:hypothetical protein
MKQFYFQHDENASNDEKLLALRDEYGWEGIGIFWALLESMARNDGYINKVAIRGLSLGYNVVKEWLTEYLKRCIELDLFKIDEKGYFSDRMIEQLEHRKYLSECGKKAMANRWGDKGVNKGVNNRRGEERKGKERKKKKIYIKKEILKNIKMNEDEYNNLTETLGNNRDKYILRLERFIATSDFKSKSHYNTIMNWYEKESNPVKDDKFYRKELERLNPADFAVRYGDDMLSKYIVI